MNDNEHWVPDVIARGRLTSAGCFKALAEMRVLTLDTIEARQQVALLCLYGWDISLLPDVASRNKEIKRLWQAREPQNAERKTDEQQAWFEREIRALISQRIKLFPTVRTLISSVKIDPIDSTCDRLDVTTATGLERFELQRLANRALAESLGRRISKICDEAEDLEYWMFDTQQGRLRMQELREDVALICGVWRVELATYRDLAVSLNAIQEAPSPKRVTGEWVKMTKEGERMVVKFLTELDSRLQSYSDFTKN